MKIKTLLIVPALLLAATVSMAQDLPPTKTFEVSSNAFRMASSQQGTVGLKECDACDYFRLRVTARTLYMIDGKRMRFDDFVETLESMEANGEYFLNVVRDERSGVVTKIYIYND